MTDTIELLEAIGRDASLRHASAEELGKILENSQASAALTAAVVFGDSSRLTQEFGQKQMEPPNSSQGLPGEDEEPDQEEGEEPPSPPAIGHGKSSLQ